jgi:hypothetical protein
VGAEGSLKSPITSDPVKLQAYYSGITQLELRNPKLA